MDEEGRRAHWRQKRAVERTYYRIVLTCGCAVKNRTRPLPRMRYVCKSGLRHGNNLVWVRADTPEGFTMYNTAGPEAHLHKSAVEDHMRARAEARANGLPDPTDPPPWIPAVQEPLPAFAPGPAKPVVSLVCGCTREVKGEPFPNERFACPLRGKNRHGVSIAWWQAEVGQRLIRNTGVERPKKPETPEPRMPEVPAPRAAVPDRPPWARNKFRVELECGCVRWERIEPPTGAHFPCNSGQAHGYRIRWITSQRADGQIGYNKAIAGNASDDLLS